MNDEMLDDNAWTRWLGEQYRATLGEVSGMLDIEAGLRSIISNSPDTP